MVTIVFLALLLSNIDAFPRNESKIVGGFDANFIDYPFVASLRDSSRKFLCGGAIIGDTWVLTAAHCDANKVKYVGFGNVYLSHQYVTVVDKAISHENFDLNTLQNDIMLVRTLNNIPFIPGVASISYNTNPQTDSILYKNMAVAGWGDIVNSLFPSNTDRLQYTSYTMQSQTTCAANNTRSKSEAPYNPQLQICALAARKSGSCFGDSGGPLVYNNLVFGVTSRLMVPDTCASGYPDVFTRVSQYGSWIKTKMSTKN